MNLNWGVQNRSDQNILSLFPIPYSWPICEQRPGPSQLTSNPQAPQPGLLSQLLPWGVIWGGLQQKGLAHGKGIGKCNGPGQEIGYNNVLITQRSNRAIGVSKLDYYTARGPPGGQFSISEEIRLQNPLY